MPATLIGPSPDTVPARSQHCFDAIELLESVMQHTPSHSSAPYARRAPRRWRQTSVGRITSIFAASSSGPRPTSAAACAAARSSTTEQLEEEHQEEELGEGLALEAGPTPCALHSKLISSQRMPSSSTRKRRPTRDACGWPNSGSQRRSRGSCVALLHSFLSLIIHCRSYGRSAPWPLSLAGGWLAG